MGPRSKNKVGKKNGVPSGGVEAVSGSENSLLNLTDEDEWLRKGMDEDGSFRGNYIETNLN